MMVRLLPGKRKNFTYFVLEPALMSLLICTTDAYVPDTSERPLQTAFEHTCDHGERTNEDQENIERSQDPPVPCPLASPGVI